MSKPRTRSPRKYKPTSVILNLLTKLAAIITVLCLVAVVGYILINGIPHLTPDIIFGEYSADNPSMSFAIFTTVILVALSIVISVPIGVASSIYLTEYAKRSNKFIRVIRLATETLAGIPSIVYGLFGALFFGTALHMGYSILTGALTVSIMILPIIIRSTEEAIKAVPDSLREGSYGLGATRLRTVMRIVLPSASPGIFSAIILSIGRIVGETAALLFTLGSVAKMPGSLMDSSRTLALHMYIATRDGGMEGRHLAFATGVILILLVLIISLTTAYLSKKAGRRNLED